MREGVKKLLKGLIPPLAARVYRDPPGRIRFVGGFASWEAGRRASRGYDSDEIAEKVKDAALKVRDGTAAYERDSVVFDKVQYSWPLLAALLWIASMNRNRLDLVDFGGSLGSTYYQTRSFLSHLDELHWSIVEQETFVRFGRRFFENQHVKFYADLEECRKGRTPDTILLSGVLQYLEKPYDLLDTVARLGFSYLVVDRTTFLRRGEDKLFVQVVPREIFDASYPCWFLSIDRFLEAVSPGYETVAEFDGFEQADVPDSVFKGFIFKRRS